MSKTKEEAQNLHEKAMALSENDKDEEAITLYKKAIKLDPEKSSSYYNMGLIYKYQCQWDKSLKCNLSAMEIDQENEAAKWNAGIAATALRKWELARSIWQDYGIKLDDNSGQIEVDLGPTPIRLNPEGDAEVVWAQRICPARARIESIPFPESSYHYDDVVLHDGAAVGYRIFNDLEYPVFNALEIFEPSTYKTIIAEIEIESDGCIEKLEELFSSTKHDFEDWTKNVRNLCRQCSEGKPHSDHDQELISEWQSQRSLGIAVFNSENISEIFDKWENLTNGKLLSINK